ncbi:MAG: hypothetical protein CMN43_00465 [SAR116 cluster bacterium]|jgi:hypothetical protein|nr:hypothetical protein [SAR116 cluster bacterium]MBL6769256.1 DUF465 domain-containing protein [Alphaproteobacteria bacterium]CAI8395929.1 MAG: Uncharacterised protein [SAR116 cluster bacterium]|tara:strand:- start:1627 stop:1833 length:207 start_codon:yes stop_codon:yes gene_type:complete
MQDIQADYIRKKLEALLSEHRDLDDVIDSMVKNQVFDQLQLQRLKKRKLGLKDEIIKLKALIVPDIIA